MIIERWAMTNGNPNSSYRFVVVTRHVQDGVVIWFNYAYVNEVPKGLYYIH